MIRARLVATLVPIALLTGVTAVSWAAAPAPSSPVLRGERVFAAHCAACHGSANNPGSIALAVKYAGAMPPLLADRQDLSEEVTRSVVRGGIANMPFYRKTEISDAELADLAAYLARNIPKDQK